MALVESIMVPSISQRKPWNEARTGGAEYSMAKSDEKGSCEHMTSMPKARSSKPGVSRKEWRFMKQMLEERAPAVFGATRFGCSVSISSNIPGWAILRVDTLSMRRQRLNLRTILQFTYNYYGGIHLVKFSPVRCQVFLGGGGLVQRASLSIRRSTKVPY